MPARRPTSTREPRHDSGARGWSNMWAFLPGMLLGFKSARLEAKYCEGRTREYFFRVDQWATLFRAGVPLLLAFRGATNFEGEGPGLHQRIIVAGAAAFMLFVGWMAYSQGEWAVRLREPLAVFLRVTVIPLTVITSFQDTMRLSSPPNWINFLLCSWLVTGLSVASTFPVAMPMHFKHHVPVTFAFVWLMLTFQVSQFCQVVEGRSDMHDYVLGSWRALSARAWNILSAVYIMDAHDATQPPIYSACNHLYTFLLLYFGLALPTYGVWALERQSRAFFLSEQRQEGTLTKAESQRESQQLSLTRAAVLMHCGLLAVLYAVGWEATAWWLVGGVEQRLVSHWEV
ncbi:unnamed protein product [Ostreobium quekettii]|uniref:Uncharacterized protein n=1 Tax=Ostreobium quekettii TaxID=121088 RepID=A0A8S1JE90_9CHLO|nr:unnamed protein product [Ostreobium quekettii]|eukprot:evm.model.scf_14.7 EVM.evm.TU.scf_14.7   scf_14:107574-112270(+)